MVLTRVQLPTEEPVSLNRAKEYIRLETDSEDDLVFDFMMGARDQLERQWDFAFLTQKWKLQDSLSKTCRYDLKKYPVNSIKSVVLEKENGTTHTLSSEEYTLSGGMRSYIQLRNRNAYISDFERITIEFLAGFDTAEQIPLPLQQAICMLTAHNYEHRRIVEDINHYTVPVSIMRLLQPFLEVRL